MLFYKACKDPFCSAEQLLVRILILVNLFLQYNFLGLFGILLNRPLNRKNHYFCSQFVYTLLKKHGLLDIGKHPELVQTIDLFELKNKSLIYEGLIIDIDRGDFFKKKKMI